MGVRERGKMKMRQNRHFVRHAGLIHSPRHHDHDAKSDDSNAAVAHDDNRCGCVGSKTCTRAMDVTCSHQGAYEERRMMSVGFDSSQVAGKIVVFPITELQYFHFS